tara:strand:- start:14 stop:778 length:765 start_codon:yes stop_codon:yes gene_type:complete
MATSKYFTVTVKPTIAASIQHTGAFGGSDLLFDWTAFEIPKGSAKLVNVTTLVRPKGDAGPTANDNNFGLVFSSTNTVSLGASHATVNNRPSNDFLGQVYIHASSHTPSTFNSTAVGTGGFNGDKEVSASPLVLTPNVDVLSTTTPGYDTIYIAGYTGDTNTDFSSIVRINDGDIDTSSPGTTLVTDGSSMDIQEHFIAGDVLHAHDDAVIGTVASVTNSTTLELTEAISTSVLADDDFVYNIHPIRIILQFER